MKNYLCKFLSVTLALAFMISVGFSQEDAVKNWYRGNVHMHSFWSDGNVFPEMAVDWYKDRGYDFIVLSDHDNLQLDEQRWIDMEQGKVQKIMEQYTKRYGEDAFETREKDGKKQIRLLTVHELKAKLDDPGKFLMIPGHEMNAGANGMTLHGNALNVTATIPFQRGDTLAESIDKNAVLVKKNGEDGGHTSVFMLNHPLWPYFDIDPFSIINTKETRLYEFMNCLPNNGTSWELFWNYDELWDIITAYRVAQGRPMIFGTGTDDTHNYLTGNVSDDTPKRQWIVVRAEKLEPENIIQAMIAGDFYVSTGTELEDVRFDRETGTLTVKVKAAEGQNYRIRFVGTKKGFDQTAEEFTTDKAGGAPVRKYWKFSPEIGVELQAVDGTEASYTLTEDDLYVRAIISTERGGAWTQPYSLMAE